MHTDKELEEIERSFSKHEFTDYYARSLIDMQAYIVTYRCLKCGLTVEFERNGVWVWDRARKDIKEEPQLNTACAPGDYRSS